MLWFKSLGLGLLFWCVVVVVAAVGDLLAVMGNPDMSDREMMVQLVINILFVWMAAVGSFLLIHIKKIKLGWRPFLVRSVFIWVPISIGWWAMSKTGAVGWFTLGGMFSSVFFAYEMLVLRTRT